MTSRATPTAKNPTHAITLSDGTYTYGFELADLPQRAIQDNTATPSTLVITGGGNKYGNGDPSFSHIEQRDWTGGRGQEDFQDDATRFRDASNLWTLTGGKCHLGPRWDFANNFGTDDGTTAWEDYAGFEDITAQSRCVEFTASATYTISYVGAWVKAKNTSTSIAVANAKLFDASGALIATSANKNISDKAPSYVTFRFSTPPSITSGTNYRLGFTGSIEVACMNTVGPAKDNTTETWSTAHRPYLKIYKTTAKKTNQFFKYGGMLYLASSDGAASKVFINGWRDKVAAGATATTFATANMATYNSSGHVKIISGTGAGQVRKIITNSGSAYTVLNFDTIPDTTSEVVIYPLCQSEYGLSTGKMIQEITSTGLSGTVKSVTVAGDTVYFAQGSGANIRKMKFDSSANAHTFADDGTNKADMLFTWFTSGKTQIVRVLNDIEVSFADLPATPYSTNLSFGTALKVGSTKSKINNIVDYNNTLWAAKEDGLWFYDAGSKQFNRLNIGLDATPSAYTGKALAAQNLYLYFSIDFSLERLYGGNQYGGTVDDIGLWKGTGLGEKSGRVEAIVSAYSWLFVAVANWKNTSVYVYNGIGYHEIFSCGATYKLSRQTNISGMAYHAFDEGNPCLWLGIDNEIIYIAFSENPFAPMQQEDGERRYIYHGYITSSGIDFGASHQPKYYNSISVSSENLSAKAYIDVDVQYDEDVGTANWTYLGTVNTSPYQKLTIGAGSKYNFAYRLRVFSKDVNTITLDTTSPVIKAIVVEGFVRTPHKRVWVVRTKTSPFQVTRMGTPDTKPSVLYDWLNEKIDQADKLTMEAIYDSMHNHSVIMDQYRLVPKSHDEIEGEDSYELWMTLREA